jgi:hypothetical protein
VLTVHSGEGVHKEAEPLKDRMVDATKKGAELQAWLREQNKKCQGVR